MRGRLRLMMDCCVVRGAAMTMMKMMMDQTAPPAADAESRNLSRLHIGDGRLKKKKTGLFCVFSCCPISSGCWGITIRPLATSMCFFSIQDVRTTRRSEIWFLPALASNSPKQRHWAAHFLQCSSGRGQSHHFSFMALFIWLYDISLYHAIVLWNLQFIPLHIFWELPVADQGIIG